MQFDCTLDIELCSTKSKFNRYMAQIRLKNFRKYESLDSLKLNNINIFVGKNNAGKSTVVKAIMLALDNIRSLRWKDVASKEGMQSILIAPKPLFRFDANGFHNLHIGTFERAKCKWLDDSRITIALEYNGIDFEITVAGVMGDGQVSMPIEKLKLSVPLHSNYEFDFVNNTMTFSQGVKLMNNQSYELQKELRWVNNEISKAENEVEEAAKNNDAIEAAEGQQKLQKLISLKKALMIEQKQQEKKSVIEQATFNLSYFHESIGENILVQYVKTFIMIADSPIAMKKNAKGYNDEISKIQYLDENRKIIAEAAEKLENVLSNIYVDYIPAHAATQKLILNVDDKQDINSRVVHEFFQENILEGEKADRFMKKWLKEFEIGENIIVTSLGGEGYYVNVYTGDNDVHLADMGMGSIQLIILLMRLATIGHRSTSTLQPWWIFIEEPEQNLHPMIQSKLADLFEDFTQTFCDPYMHTLIIETHSEYLVRRTQVMAAEYVEKYLEPITDDMFPFKVVYFPVERGKQPYDMQYLPNGMFANKFDSGFFDEAGRMHMEILKKSRKG